MTKRIIAGVTSVQGLRPYQEDRYCIVNSLGQGKYFFAGIFDGHGGSEAAEYAKNKLHVKLEKFLPLKNNPLEALKSAFIETDDDIHQLKIQSGTTASVVLVRGYSAYIANVGDSGIYIKKPTLPMQKLTIDHHLTNPNELKQYRSSKWFLEKSRLISQGKIKGFKLIAVSRSLGDLFFEDAISPIPDISEVEFNKGDVIILATDGLWNYIEPIELETELSKKSDDPKILSEQLAKKALSNNSKDNITVILLSN